MLKNIRNLFPYFLLIAIYFFFVNLEARNDNNNIRNTQKQILDDDTSSIDKNKLRIAIPVIPYNQ